MGFVRSDTNMQKIIWTLGLLLSMGACTSYQSLQPVTDLYDTSTKIDSDEEIDAMIAPYKAKLAEEMEQVIGEAGNELEKAKPESTLGNFVADAILEIAQDHYDKPIDFSLPNYGGLRVPYVKKGDITKGEIFELMPFDNILVVLTIDGAMVEQLFTHTIHKGGWPLSKGVRIEADTIAQKYEFYLHDKKVEKDKKYRFCVSDYIANGGDKCDFLKDQERDDIGGLLFRDALLEYVEKKTAEGKAVKAVVEGRFAYKSF